jgi:uncharacterized membrane protein
VDFQPGFGVHFFWFLWLLMIGGAVLIPVIIILAVRATSRPAYPIGAPPVQPGMPQPPPPPAQTPLDILARRFASGEISAEEYERARDLLQGGKS